MEKKRTVGQGGSVSGQKCPWMDGDFIIVVADVLCASVFCEEIMTSLYETHLTFSGTVNRATLKNDRFIYCYCNK